MTSRTLLISALAACFVAGTWQIPNAAEYQCDTSPPPRVICTVDDRVVREKPTHISCRTAEDAPSLQISCVVIYSAQPGYTWTGLQGYNWLCGADIVVPENELQNPKAVCDRFCGTCDGEWQ